MKLSLDSSLCRHCNLCVLACPSEVFKNNPKNDSESAGTAPKINNTHLCIECGQCVAICPDGAIAHKGVAGVHPILSENLPQPSALEELLNSHLSKRAGRDRLLR